MNKDEQIAKLMQELLKETNFYLNYIKILDECSHTDRKIEKIINIVNQIEILYKGCGKW